ncbi:membrane protein [Bacteroidia bacterium]|nr:membrane protein [Bacteroidia bacterium]
MATAVLLSSSVLFSSCIGSFTLSRKVLAWNQSVGDQWINELIFVALAVVQVYTISVLIDGVVLNSIEFWTGENPASADVQVKQVETKNGLVTITTDANGHKIQKEGSDEIVEFRFNKAENSWSLEALGETTPLVQFTGENQAKVYLADGSTMTVTTDQAGVLALRQALGNAAFFANK